MKGVYSIPTNVLSRYTDINIFPNNTYFYDSGGDPKDIPTLTFENLVAFHEKFYHPSNSKIFVSGVATKYDKMNDTLTIIDEYLSEFEENTSIKNQSVVEYQKKNIETPFTMTYPYQAATGTNDDGNETSSKGQHIVQVSWLLNDEPLTALQELALLVLDHLLVMTETSILKKRLLESQLGDSIVGWGISTSLIQSLFSMGLNGVKEEHVSDVEQLIIATMMEAADNGFTNDEISASMNTLEFQVSYCIYFNSSQTNSFI